jgi:hypothetical protein
MQLKYQQYWCFAPSGAPLYAPVIGTKPGLLRRTLRRVGGQIIVLALVLLDISGLGFALVASIWLAPWVAINVTALVLGSLSCSEDRAPLRRGGNKNCSATPIGNSKPD